MITSIPGPDHRPSQILIQLAIAMACLGLAGCKPAVARYASDGVLPALQAASTALPAITVHKSATCVCCAAWIDHLRQTGFAVRVVNEENITTVKDRLGVPPSERSCHTAEVGGYFVEGHVPAEDIKRLLAQHPTARGLALPGMPAGSPGMEAMGMPATGAGFTVDLVGADGRVSSYAAHTSENRPM